VPTPERAVPSSATPPVTPGRQIVPLRLLCLAPPVGHDEAGAEFGLLDKAGRLHAGERQPDGALHYAFDLEIIGHDRDAQPRWRGVFLHGTAATPFRYLGWRPLDAGGLVWLRRLKIPLTTITRAQIDAVATGSGALTATISGEGSGTVPLLGKGWTASGTSHAQPH